jgi:hypothetical protein
MLTANLSSCKKKGINMLELEIDKAELKTVNDHRYYIFPSPITHQNQTNRPTEYADEKGLKTYLGKGSNNAAKLHPDVLTPAGVFMTALIEYGEKIDDWSMRSAVIQSGWRPDDPSQGANYLRIIKTTIERNPKIFGKLTFPSDLEEDAKGVLGRQGDSRRTAFQQRVAESPGWSQALAYALFQKVDSVYAPRGSNPHTTGFVFDLDFSIYYCQGVEKKGGEKTCTDSERKLGADTRYNSLALTSAAGMWINKYSMQFSFDSYDTGKEIWHMEYRQKK